MDYRKQGTIGACGLLACTLVVAGCAKSADNTTDTTTTGATTAATGATTATTGATTAAPPAGAASAGMATTGPPMTTAGATAGATNGATAAGAVTTAGSATTTAGADNTGASASLPSTLPPLPGGKVTVVGKTSKTVSVWFHKLRGTAPAIIFLTSEDIAHAGNRWAINPGGHPVVMGSPDASAVIKVKKGQLWKLVALGGVSGVKTSIPASWWPIETITVSGGYPAGAAATGGAGMRGAGMGGASSG